MATAVQDSEYARILTNSEEMEDLTDLIRMNGMGTDGQVQPLVEDTIIHFGEDSVEVKAFDPMTSVWVHVRGPFSGVRRPGKLLVGDIEEFRDYLGRFGENTIISMEPDQGVMNLTFEDETGKTGGFTATDEAHINSTDDVDNLPYGYDPVEHEFPGAYEKGIILDTWFECDVSRITDVVKDGDTTGVRKYPISVENGTVSIRVGDDESWIETSFDASGEGSARSVYGYGVDNIFRNLEGEIEFYLVDGSVAWIHQEPDEGDNEYTINYMLAEDEMGV